MNVSWPAILVICGALIAVVLVLFWHPQRFQRKADMPAHRQRPGVFFRDDDQYWTAGLYNNPDDPDLFVPKRFGLGWTVNIGHPRGKLVIIGTLLVPLALMILTLLVSGTHPVGCHPSGCHPSP